jgi:TatD DNase family protein
MFTDIANSTQLLQAIGEKPSHNSCAGMTGHCAGSCARTAARKSTIPATGSSHRRGVDGTPARLLMPLCWPCQSAGGNMFAAQSVSCASSMAPSRSWLVRARENSGQIPVLPSDLVLIDSHAHLQAEAFAADRHEVLAAARLAGVRRILVPGWDLDSSLAAIELARTEGLQASAGIHPHVASRAEHEWSAASELAEDPLVAAVGETGLDYDRGFSPRDDQLANLRRHLELGKDLGKPVILHGRSRPGERDSQDDLLRELTEAGAGTLDWRTARGRPPAVLHSFSGPVDYAERALELGLAISFSGLVFRRGEETSAQVARLVPADRLLVETDSPYLSPPGASRRRNEPQWVSITCRWLAAERGEEPHALGVQLVANYERIFARSSS